MTTASSGYSGLYPSSGVHCISTQVHKDRPEQPLTTTTSGHNGHCPSSGANCVSTQVHNDQLGQQLLTTATLGYTGSLAYIYNLPLKSQEKSASQNVVC